jgi:hypothetical protein
MKEGRVRGREGREKRSNMRTKEIERRRQRK